MEMAGPMSQTNKQLYIGLTIGPIFPTLEKIKSTRGLFSGSYLFSWLMREIISQLLKTGINDEQILTPSTFVPVSAPEAGFYADRLIIAANPGDFDTLLAVQKKVLHEMANLISSDVKKNSVDVEDYLHRYLQLYSVELELDSGAGDDPFMKVNYLLNGLELQRRFPDVDEDWMTEFLNQKKGNFLIKNAFGKNSQFSSISEISTSELRKLNPSIYNRTVLDALKQRDETQMLDAKSEESVFKQFQVKDSAFREHFRAYHKYVAVVHADGDGIGKHIGTLDQKGFKKFSNQLFQFGQKAKDEIKAYGGAAVFIGGDDMLFLAPVAAQSKLESTGAKTLKTVFHLIKDLDTIFHESFTEFGEKAPTFSYGVSLNYYKYPLNEARALSYHQLDEVAKKIEGKNALAFHLKKHSGAYMEATFRKDQPDFKYFLRMIEDLAVEQTFLSSLIHRFGFHQSTLEFILGTGKGSEKRLEFFFENNFDEAVHKEEKLFFSHLTKYLIELYNVESKTALSKLNATLRFIHFLRSKGNEE